jgi:hypothetical protein
LVLAPPLKASSTSHSLAQMHDYPKAQGGHAFASGSPVLVPAAAHRLTRPILIGEISNRCTSNPHPNPHPNPHLNPHLDPNPNLNPHLDHSPNLNRDPLQSLIGEISNRCAASLSLTHHQL